MHPRRRWENFCTTLAAFFLATFAPAVWAADRGTNPVQTVVLKTEGRVEILRKAAKDWEPAKEGQSLEAGYRVRTGPKSRAMLRLSNLSVLHVGELMEYELQPPRSEGGKPTLSIKAGAAYFFSRDKPRELDLRTPIATGAIRGTEFNVLVAEDGKTTLTLVDGEVELSNAQGSVVLTNGEQGLVQEGRVPVKTAVLNAVNIIQWNLYYPGVLDPAELGLTQAEQEAVGESLSAYRQGDLLAALAKYPTNRTPVSASEKVYHAQVILAVGSVAEAEAELSGLPENTDHSARLANALRQIISTVTLSSKKQSASPILASEWLAESYQRQSQAQLKASLTAARKAVEQSPQFAFGWEQVAELEFSFGHTAPALEALNKSLALAPRNAQAVALKGFLLAAQNRIGEALRLFDDAIALDGALGNAWLGRGLCLIRQGHAQAGREDLETAAALEPNRAVLRSYLGKAFSEVGDSPRAEHELELAKHFDPNDPTSWLYSALLHQQQNRINQAIGDLEKSEQANENRRVYRSGFLLEQDAAVRGANLASIYRDAGMDDLSVREATRAVNADYGNYSAHLFLANSYNQLRDPNQINLRYETPWLTEYLLANLLAPVAAGTLSQTVSQQDYSKLFERDHAGVASSTEYFSRGDWTQAGSTYGNFGNFGYAFDSLYRSQNGWRPNNGLDQLTLSLQFKQQITPQDIVFFQGIYYNATAGDLAQYYDQSQAHAGLRTKETQEPLLLAGYSHEWAPGVHTLLLAGRFDDTAKASDTNQAVLAFGRSGGNIVAVPASAFPTTTFDYRSRLEMYSVEAQQIFEAERHTLILGGRFQTGTFDTQSTLGPTTNALQTSSLVIPIPFIATNGLQSTQPDFERWSLYGYYNFRPLEPLLLSLGIVYDYLRTPLNFRAPPISGGEDSEDRISPKAGFTWTPLRDTTVRFAWTRSLGGVSFDESVRLEPSQVAGFNQGFRSLIPETLEGSIAGAKFETFGVALEQKLPTRTYLGLEGQILDSDAHRTIGAVEFLPTGGFSYTSGPSGTRQNLNYTERDILATVNQLVGENWSLGARYWFSQALLNTSLPEVPAFAASSFKSHQEAFLHQLGIFALYNHPSGFFARADALWNYQINGGDDSALHNADFWQFNLLAGYRFWHRRAQIQVGILNLSGQDYQLNPVNLYTELPRRREFTTSFQFNF